jgi:hypothetical protein
MAIYPYVYNVSTLSGLISHSLNWLVFCSGLIKRVTHGMELDGGIERERENEDDSSRGRMRIIPSTAS